MTSLISSQKNTKRSRTRLMIRRIKNSKFINFKLQMKMMMTKTSQMKLMRVILKMKRSMLTTPTIPLMILKKNLATWKMTTKKLRHSKLKNLQLEILVQALMKTMKMKIIHGTKKTLMTGKLLNHTKREDSEVDGTKKMTTHGIKRMLMIGKP